MGRICLIINAFFALLTQGLMTSHVYAVTQYRPEAIGFIRDPNMLRASIAVPVREKIVELQPPVKTVLTRIEKSPEDKRIEPLAISVPKNEQELEEFSEEISQEGKAKEARLLLLEKLRKRGPNNFKSVRVEVEKGDMSVFDPTSLAGTLAKTHHDVSVLGGELFQRSSVRQALFDQLKPFFSVAHRKALWNRMKGGDEISLDEELLPSFARKVVRKFLVFRGPNCFHAALSFHGQKLTQSPFVNVKEEKGYHEAMINYDELWRAITQNFYEVNPVDSPLKYGDMLVFFNIPEKPEANINFRWIRHTATYLFGPYTFSKGSKSPDTPYSVKTLEEEWNTWLGYTQRMGVKIYRRNLSKVKKAPPIDLTDWIY